jgi:hypothetical protein
MAKSVAADCRSEWSGYEPCFDAFWHQLPASRSGVPPRKNGYDGHADGKRERNRGASDMKFVGDRPGKDSEGIYDESNGAQEESQGPGQRDPPAVKHLGFCVRHSHI